MQREPGFVPQMPPIPETIPYWARPKHGGCWEVVFLMPVDPTYDAPDDADVWFSSEGYEIDNFKEWYEIGPRITPPEEK